jgi:hypothetical protein
MARRKSKPHFKFCGCPWDEECLCSPPEVLEANQKMWAERFAKLNHENRRKTKRRQDRLNEKRESKEDFDFGGPI